jgi:hypothetical protein
LISQGCARQTNLPNHSSNNVSLSLSLVAALKLKDKKPISIRPRCSAVAIYGVIKINTPKLFISSEHHLYSLSQGYSQSVRGRLNHLSFSNLLCGCTHCVPDNTGVGAAFFSVCVLDALLITQDGFNLCVNNSHCTNTEFVAAAILHSARAIMSAIYFEIQS